MSTTSTEFESFSEDDELWLSDLETRAMDLENDISEWREARERALAEDFYRSEPLPHASFRRVAGKPSPARADGRRAANHTAARRAAARSQARPRSRARADDARARELIDYGRRGARHRSLSRGQKIAITLAILAAGLTVLVLVLRPSASWPPSVAVVQSEIATACQNPDIAAEPNQVNFACGKSTSQVLWVFSLMSSGDNANFSDAASGRMGLEPVTPTLGGEVAWSLNLHHPYNPYNPVDSLQVAARAINNIVGGATLTSSNGQPTVQPGLESDPANCARYTGSAAMLARAGYPDLCAAQVTTVAGQAALVADIYQKWFVGASATAAQDASVLFQNANDPGNPQVQAILKSLFGPSA